MFNLESLLKKSVGIVSDFNKVFLGSGKYLSMALLGASLLSNPGCKPDDPLPDSVNSIVVKGHVKNNPHNAYVAGVDVFAESNNKVLGHALTNNDGYFSLKLNDEHKNFNLKFSYDNHVERDTLLEWKSHNLNPVLQVKPVSEEGVFNLNVLSDDSPVGDALVKLYSNPINNDLGELLREGFTNSEGMFSENISQVYWVYGGDTISKVEDLGLVVSASNYVDTTLFFDYVKEMNLDLVLREATNSFWLSGNGSPIDAKIQGWLSGDVILDGIVVNDFYETNKHSSNNSEVVLDSLIMRKQGFHAEKHYDFVLSPGNNDLDFSLDEMIASARIVSLNLSSSNPDKSPKSFRGYVISGNDTIVAKNFNGSQGSLSFEFAEDELVEVGAVSIPYFNNTKKQIILQEENNEALVVEPKIFTYSVNGSVLFEDDDIASAIVNIANREANTNNGVYSLADIVRETNNNNEPRTYDEQIVVRGDFDTQQKSFAVDGSDKEINFTIPLNKFWLYSENAKPNDAMIKGWLNNNVIFEAEVVNNNYETNKHEAKDSKITLDSLVVVKQGFDKLKRTNMQLNNNGTRFDFDLNEVIGDETFEVSIKPYTADNVSMADFLNEPYTLFVKNKRTGETKTFTQQSNNSLNIEINGNLQDELLIWHLHDKLADYIVMEHPDQYWTDKNIAQNYGTRNWDHTQRFDTLKTTIQEIANHKYNKNKPIELYTPRYEYEVEGYGGGGAVVRFSDEIVARMLAGRGDGGGGYIKNWKLPGITHIDKIFLGYKLKSSDPWDTSEPISQQKLDEMMYIAREVLKVSNSASGRVRLPYVEHIVNSRNDDIVQVAEARGWDETSISWRYDGTPNNSLSWDNVNLRIKYGTAMYAVQQNPGSIYAEEFEHLYGTIDPVIGSSSAYIFELDQNNKLVLNALARTMGAVSAMSDRGTRLLPANK